MRSVPGVVIAGVAECDLGVTSSSILELHAQGITRALADAGIALSEVDGLACTSVARFSGTQLADYLGIQPAWQDSTFAGGSAFEMFVARGAQAIASGQASVVVISFASNQRSQRSRAMGGIFEPHTPEAQFEGPYGPLYPLSHYGMAAQRYQHTTGAGREHLAEVAVAARQWALLNPKAFRYEAGPLTVDDVLASPVISSPLSAADCCLVTDGGGAIVLVSAERAKELPKQGIHVLGYGESTDHSAMSTPDDLLRTGAYASGARAFAMAGLSPADVDVAQLYDSFTITVLLSLEGLGFCPPGSAWQFVQDGRIAPGGTFALNTSGGGLSYCHPGQFGVLLLVEAVRQPRGECGDRQVSGAEVALAHGTGGYLVDLCHRAVGSGPMSDRVVQGPAAEPDVAAPDATTQGWWDATRERRLVVQQCTSCGHLQHYPRALCTSCAGLTLGWVDVSGTAVIDAFTVVHRGLAGYDAPYVVARVRLVEGPILLTNLVGGDVGAWTIGDAVEVVWQPLADGRHLPLFTALATQDGLTASSP